MFALNKDTRSFLETNSITIRNGFINDGLIPYKIDISVDGSLQLEKIY